MIAQICNNRKVSLYFNFIKYFVWVLSIEFILLTTTGMNPETLSYLPQRPPFVMIGELVLADEVHTIATYTIPEDNLFVNNGVFSESGMIENMAQTAGAGVGYRTLNMGKPLQTGYIAALRNVKISARPRVNDPITTEITFQQSLLGFHLVIGKIRLDDIEIASCEFKIFVNNNQQQ